MKELSCRKLALLPVLALTLATASLSAQAGALEDFESNPDVVPENRSDEATKVEVVDDPSKAGNHVMKISWGPHSGTHVAGSLTAPGAELIGEAGKYEVSARVNLEQCPSEAIRLGIRVVDAGNETFQYSAELETQGEPGWTEVKWEIDTSAPLPGTEKSWGDRVDEVMDFPVKFYGFALPLKDYQTGGGFILMDDVSVKKLD